MSAYIVDREHIVYLVSAALSRSINRYGGVFSWYWKDAPQQERRHNQLGAGDYEKAALVATMLWSENVKSVQYRYPEDTLDELPGPTMKDFAIQPSDFRIAQLQFSAVQVLKSIACLEYQSCEHPQWEQSEAFAFLKALEGAAIGALPGYDDAAWGAPERKVA